MARRQWVLLFGAIVVCICSCNRGGPMERGQTQQLITEVYGAQAAEQRMSQLDSQIAGKSDIRQRQFWQAELKRAQRDREIKGQQVVAAQLQQRADEDAETEAQRLFKRAKLSNPDFVSPEAAASIKTPAGPFLLVVPVESGEWPLVFGKDGTLYTVAYLDFYKILPNGKVSTATRAEVEAITPLHFDTHWNGEMRNGKKEMVTSVHMKSHLELIKKIDVSYCYGSSPNSQVWAGQDVIGRHADGTPKVIMDDYAAWVSRGKSKRVMVTDLAKRLGLGGQLFKPEPDTEYKAYHPCLICARAVSNDGRWIAGETTKAETGKRRFIWILHNPDGL